MFGVQETENTSQNKFAKSNFMEKTLENPLDCKEIQPVHLKGNQSWIHWKDWCWSWNSNTLATWCEELTHWKRPWCWERLQAGGEGDDRGWDGWMASLTQWTWVWVSSGSWWWTGRPGVLWCMESQRVGHDWALNWTEQEIELELPLGWFTVFIHFINIRVFMKWMNHWIYLCVICYCHGKCLSYRPGHLIFLKWCPQF